MLVPVRGSVPWLRREPPRAYLARSCDCTISLLVERFSMEARLVPVPVAGDGSTVLLCAARFTRSERLCT